jgi:two-component system response regulator YesN
MPCRMLLVDDESIILEGLRRNIPWKENGIEVIGEARDGRKALKLVGLLRPDIVMTDIRMPVMDGLELADRLSSDYPEVKVIVLTVLDEFNVVKRSLQARVVDYVLKYNYKDAALPAALKACAISRRELEERQRTAGERGILRRSYLRACLLGHGSDRSAPDRELRSHFGRGGLCACVLRPHVGPVRGLADRVSAEALQAVLDTTLCGAFSAYSVDVERDLCFVACISGDSPQARAKFASCAAATAEKVDALASGDRISAFLGRPRTDLRDIHESFMEAVSAADLHQGAAEQRVVLFEDIWCNAAAHELAAKKAARFIEENYRNAELDLQMISYAVCLSPAYFSTVYKRQTGTNLSDYIISVRLRHAKELLETTDLKIHEIADLVGYASPQYLSRLFRRLEGCSPGDFRARRRCPLPS